MPVFGACCLSSSIDWPVVWNTSENRQDMTPDKVMALSFIHAGALCYIGATEESWGAFFGGLNDGNPDRWGFGDFDLATMFFSRVFTGEDIGTALMNAKEFFYTIEWQNEADRPFARTCYLETVLYGLPDTQWYYPGAAVPVSL
ncbi:MAG: hypothetical protein QW728_06175 [Thermoplasmata archaeon]